MRICVIGGTGTIGQALVERLVEENEVTVFSRDEHKQNLMRRKYKNVKFEIGDIRDYRRTIDIVQDADIVYHLAALKHVRTGEKNPVETILTNVMGTHNVIKACENTSVHKLIFMSSDKSVYPHNVYGTSKMVGERLINNSQMETIVVRSGNLVKSSGSAIPFFLELKKQGKRVPLTSILMERYFVSTKKLIDILISAMSETNCTIVPKMIPKKIVDIIKELECEYDVIGLQRGEKLHEDMWWSHEDDIKEEHEKYFVIRGK